MKKTHENISEGTRDFKGRHRDRMEALGGRLNLLSGADKVLMTMYVQNGNSFRQIACIRGVSETSIARRIRTIVQRLTNSEYIRCVRNSDKLTVDQMGIAKDFFLMGQPMSKIARTRGTSVYVIRRALLDIRDLLTLYDAPHDGKESHGSVQYFKKFQMAGDNH